MNWEGLDWTILGPAFLAGLMVLSTHVPLGQQVLARGIIFIDLALAQVAALGVILALHFGTEEHSDWVRVAAATAALLGAGLLAWTDRRWPDLQEPLIGTLFVLAASGGVLLLANSPHGGEHLKELLVGQILWVTPSQLLHTAVMTAVLLAAMVALRGRMTGLYFYAVFALAITASVQLVGVYLVFASLIVPALATVRLQGPRRLVLAYLVGILGYASGLALSAVLDLPSGALIVWTLAASGFAVRAVVAVARRHAINGDGGD